MVQLYNLDQDPEEANNLQAEDPERVQRMIRKLVDEIRSGRSTPGPGLDNDSSDFGFHEQLLARFPDLRTPE